jgi:hypothetical protein
MKEQRNPGWSSLKRAWGQAQHATTQKLNLYSPHQGQSQIHQSKKRFNIICFGRQSGKTTYGLNKILDRAWVGRDNSVYWYVLQTYSAAKVAFNRIRDTYRQSPGAFLRRPNESGLTVYFNRGQQISFKSGKNFQDLRAETLDGVVIDEYRQQSPELWPMIIRPMLSRHQGWSDILSTPNGFEHFYDLFEAAEKDPEWSTFQAPSTVAPWWRPEEIESARKAMSEAEFAQEILAEFRDLTSGKAYLTNGTHNHRTDSPFTRDGSLVSPHLPIVVGMDFNVTPISWVLGQTNGERFYWFDEIYLENSHTQEASIELIEKVRNHKAGVTICGDASGNAMKTSAVGRSDYAIIEQMLTEAGISWTNITPASNPSVKDRVNSVNMRLKNAQGETTMWYHPEHCRHLKRDLERVVWKAGASAILDQHKDPSLTHMSDAMGYPVAELTKVWEPSPGVLRIIRR